MRGEFFSGLMRESLPQHLIAHRRDDKIFLSLSFFESPPGTLNFGNVTFVQHRANAGRNNGPDARWARSSFQGTYHIVFFFFRATHTHTLVDESERSDVCQIGKKGKEKRREPKNDTCQRKTSSRTGHKQACSCNGWWGCSRETERPCKNSPTLDR